MNNYFMKLGGPEPAREVEAFTIRTFQKNTTVVPLPKIDLYQERPKVKNRVFKYYYDSRRLPLAMNYSSSRLELRWLINPEYLDFEYYLPIFFEGLNEMEHPYEFLAMEASRRAIVEANAELDIIRNMSNLVDVLRSALKTRVPRVVAKYCEILRYLTGSSPSVAQSMVHFYRILLPDLNLFLKSWHRVRLPSSIPFESSLGGFIWETLAILEMTTDAHQEIKLFVPLYESILQ